MGWVVVVVVACLFTDYMLQKLKRKFIMFVQEESLHRLLGKKK